MDSIKPVIEETLLLELEGYFKHDDRSGLLYCFHSFNYDDDDFSVRVIPYTSNEIQYRVTIEEMEHTHIVFDKTGYWIFNIPSQGLYCTDKKIGYNDEWCFPSTTIRFNFSHKKKYRFRLYQLPDKQEKIEE